jgi:phosphoserine phosphatase
MLVKEALIYIGAGEFFHMRPAPSSVSTGFVQKVLHKKPRIAVFDCDGTLWSGDAGADFFYYEIERGLIPTKVKEWALARYQGYKIGEVDEITMCGEMVTIHEGVSEIDIRNMAREFFASTIAQRIFGEMQELTHCLAESGCELWAVSSTNNWVIEEGVRRFGIPADRVLAATVEVKDGKATGKLIQVPTDEAKVTAIQKHIPKAVDAIFGNSIHDFHMLEIARLPYAINPSPELEAAATERGWPIHRPL